jgi:MraZ protein
VHQHAVRAFAADAREVRPDTQGRIMIPPHLRDYAGLDTEVTVIGAIDRIELWDTATWQATHDEASSSYRSAVDEFGI